MKDKEIVKAIQSRMLKFSKELAVLYGLELQKCNASFNEFEMNFKIVFHSTNDKGRDIYQNAYLKYAEIYGLEKEWLGKEIKAGRLLLTIRGLDRKKKKYPIILTDDGGFQYKMTISDFLSYSQQLNRIEVKNDVNEI